MPRIIDENESCRIEQDEAILNDFCGNVVEKGCEKEEYTYALYREGYPPAERYPKERYVEGSF